MARRRNARRTRPPGDPLAVTLGDAGGWTSKEVIEAGVEVLGRVAAGMQDKKTLLAEEVKLLCSAVNTCLAVTKEARETGPNVPDSKLTDMMARQLATDFGIDPGALFEFLRSARAATAS